MHSAGLFAAAALATVIGLRAEDTSARDSMGGSQLPDSVTVNCDDGAQLRERASRDRRESRDRGSDQQKIDLANRARFVATLATVADLKCKVSLPDADQILRRALDMAREAERAGSFYARTLKWQEAGLIADEAVSLMIQRLPNLNVG